MADIVSSAVRSRMMSGIKAIDTKPEILVRKALHTQGYRFRIHRKDLPGKPDIVLPRFRAVILVHGCFWHMHKSCKLARIPSTRTEFWSAKLHANAVRDQTAHSRLLALEWRVLTIWECYLKSTSPEVLQADLARWISASEISGDFNVGPTATV
jgi:DNA mismatch endonuclease (patch repair protein)